MIEVTKEYPVVLVTGLRQVGKATMLQQLMAGTSRGYVSLDDLTGRALAKSDPELFLQLHQPPVLTDEVQYAPELFPFIKLHVDRSCGPGSFWLTGAQIFKLMRGGQESLAGRVAVLSMTSPSQAEIGGGRTEPFLYYYRDKDAKEIDLVLEQDGVLNPIETKKPQTPAVN